MAEPKTVSNLPLDVSIRWAEDQKLLEETRPMIAGSAGIPLHAQKDVSMPASFPEIETLLGIRTVHPTWAIFYRPLGYNEQKRRLFTSQIAPFLGSDEQHELQIQRILAKGEEDEEEKKERETLVKLLNLIHLLNRDLVDILSRCRQYQKG